MMTRAKLFALTLAAIAVQIALGHLWLALEGDTDPDSGSMWAIASSPLIAVVSVLPSFLLGALAKRDGFLIGSFVGLVSGPVGLVLVAARWGSVPSLGTFAPHLLAAAFASAITCSVAAAAGQLFSQRTRSNYVLKPTAGETLSTSEPPGPAAA